MSFKDQRPINKSSLSEFLLLEFSEVWELKILHFVGFLIIYLGIVVVNLLIISAIISDYYLNTPMYFFLMNLAIQDVGQVSVILPKSMANALMNTTHISYSGCVAQVLVHVFFLASYVFLLTVMAYDRYIAICNPLQYEIVITRHACLQMVTAVWVISLIFAILHTVGIFGSPLCSNVVNQFFCEIPHLLKLVCSDFYLIEVGFLLLSAMVSMSCFVFIIMTYVHIFTAVIKMPSVQKKQKAFSTCIPHLTVFSVYLLTGFLNYFKPTSDLPSQFDLSLTMIYSIVPPLMNPVIYSMRNREIRTALKKLLGLRSGLNLLN
ncbi:olfactory receptor 14C36 [Anolis carolinensis]|uniref:olfactory receptor 14C36 n=1 Tax=Anolis carolinensis TaxID=28377 RepID=UPI002F2B4608